VLSVMCLLPLTLGVHAVVFLAGTIRADRERLELRSVAGRFALPWDQITEVEVDQQHVPLVFCAGDRRLPLPSWLYWTGPDKAALVSLVQTQIRERKVPTRLSAWAAYRRPRGVRVLSGGR
jgi:hypothetical protein